MTALNLLTTAIIVGLFILCHGEAKYEGRASTRDIVAEYAHPVSNGLTNEENRMLVALASHMGRHK